MIWVAKASKPTRQKWKKTRTKNRLEALANSMAGSVRLDLLRGLKKFKSKINPQEIYDAFVSKDWNRVFEAVPWKSLADDLAPLAKNLSSALHRSTSMSLKALPEPVQEGLRFDLRNPRIRSYVDNRTGALVRDIAGDTRALIQNAVARHFDEAMTPRRVADIIKPSIGLYPAQVRALQNYRLGLEKDGVKPSMLETLSDKYHDRLLDARSLMIARTETKSALNEGQLSVWNQAADQGLIDRGTVKKQWVLDGNPCEVCIAVLDGEDGGAIPLDDLFVLDFGGRTGEVSVNGPPGHPNCMCSLELIYPEASEGVSRSTGGEEDVE